MSFDGVANATQNVIDATSDLIARFFDEAANEN
jgi:hypothetical protein